MIMEQVFLVIYYRMILMLSIKLWILVYRNMPHLRVVFISTKMGEMSLMYGMQHLNTQIIKMVGSLCFIVRAYQAVTQEEIVLWVMMLRCKWVDKVVVDPFMGLPLQPMNILHNIRKDWKME